jgi:methylmalonyl-CoA carboxyltransferase 5S subunit
MFPQVAPKFFDQRAQGPKNVGKSPAATDGKAPAPATPAGATTKPADGKGPVTTTVTYQVRIGDKSHKVTVEPA